MNDERRQHQRKPWPLNINLQIAENGQVGPDMQVQTIDFSAGGICILAKQALPNGTVLNFGKTPMKGIVRWSTPFDKEHKIGVELI
jgi:hypothetical protein